MATDTTKTNSHNVNKNWTGNAGYNANITNSLQDMFGSSNTSGWSNTYNSGSSSQTSSGTRNYYDDINKYNYLRAQMGSLPTLTRAQMDKVSLLSNPEYAKKAGIDPNLLNKDAIYAILAQGAQKELTAGLTGVENAQNSFGKYMGQQQNSYIDAIRKANAGAVNSGVSKGALASQELATMLGIQQSGTESATNLANQEQEQYNTFGKSLNTAMTTAEQQAMDRNLAIANLAQEMYGTDKDAAVRKYDVDQTANNSEFVTGTGAVMDKYKTDAQLYGDIISAVLSNPIGSDSWSNTVNSPTWSRTQSGSETNTRETTYGQSTSEGVTANKGWSKDDNTTSATTETPYHAPVSGGSGGNGTAASAADYAANGYTEVSAGKFKWDGKTQVNDVRAQGTIAADILKTYQNGTMAEKDAIAKLRKLTGTTEEGANEMLRQMKAEKANQNAATTQEAAAAAKAAKQGSVYGVSTPDKANDSKAASYVKAWQAKLNWWGPDLKADKALREQLYALGISSAAANTIMDKARHGAVA